MGTKAIAVLLVGALLALGVSWQAAVNADLQAEPSTEPSAAAKTDIAMETDGVAAYLGDPVFAKRVAGSYLFSFLITNPFTGETELSGNVIGEVRADGTASLAFDQMFGQIGRGPANAFAMPGSGAWERTGRRQIKWHVIWFAQDRETMEPGYAARQEARLDFSDDFQSVEGMFFTSLLLPGAAGGKLDEVGIFYFTACERYDCVDPEDETGCCDCCAMRDCKRGDDGQCLPGLYIPDETTDCILTGDSGSCLDWCVERSGGPFAPCDRTADTPDEDHNGAPDSTECFTYPANPNAGPDECPWYGPYQGRFIGARVNVLPDDWAPWPD